MVLACGGSPKASSHLCSESVRNPHPPFVSVSTIGIHSFHPIDIHASKHIKSLSCFVWHNQNTQNKQSKAKQLQRRKEHWLHHHYHHHHPLFAWFPRYANRYIVASISNGAQYVTPDSKLIAKTSKCAGLAQEIGFSAPNSCSLPCLVKGAT